MPQSTQMERGHLYKAESPRDNFGAGLKGVSIGVGRDRSMSTSSPFPLGADKQATRLRKVWGAALGAGRKFGSLFK